VAPSQVGADGARPRIGLPPSGWKLTWTIHKTPKSPEL
jgi:hypothetical protein